MGDAPADQPGGPLGRLEWGRPAEPIPPPRGLWREPVRAAIGLACLGILVAVTQPMASGTTPFDGPVSANALSGVGDGTLLVFVVVGMAVVVFNRAAAESEHLVPSLVPLVLGIGALLEFGLVAQGVQFAIADWAARGGSGAPTAAFYVLGAAVAVIVVGGAILTWRARRRAAAARKS